MDHSTRQDRTGTRDYRNEISDLDAEGDSATPKVPLSTESFARHQEGKIGTHFRGIKTIGTGAYGTVLAIEPRVTQQELKRTPRPISDEADSAAREPTEDKMLFACKCMLKGNLDDFELQQMKQEIELLKRCDHPNIIKFYAHYEDAKQIFLVQELCEGGELFDCITDPAFYKGANRISREKKACIILKQLLSGVAYLHQMGVIHRDMKPENVLLRNAGDITNLKIIDFGLSAKWRVASSKERSSSTEDLLHEQVGTPYYIAPEVLEKQYGPKCDVWSLGVILFVLICGQAPFWGRDDRTILRKVREKKFSMQGAIWNEASPELKDLITQMLAYPPSNRISAGDALRHPWFQIAALGLDASPNALTPRQLDEKAWTNLRKLHGYNRLQEAVRLCISYQSNKDVDIKALTQTFRSMDIDGNGLVDRQEFVSAYLAFKESQNTIAPTGVASDVLTKEAKQAFARIDLNGDGFIAISEWLAATLDDEYMQSEDRLRSAFQVFDINGDGKIEVNEMMSILGLTTSTSGTDKTAQTCGDIIRKFDSNNDGYIDFNEFCQILYEPKLVASLSTS